MKKIMFTALVAVFTVVSLNAQTFGLRAGVDLATAKAKVQGLTVSSNETGFYIGAFTNIAVSDSFDIRPELNYISIEDLDQIQIPVLAKIYLAEKFNILVGPSFGFLLDAGDGMKSFNLGADLGVTYDIGENFLLEARYDMGLTNLIDNGSSDYSTKLHGIQLGVGYIF